MKLERDLPHQRDAVNSIIKIFDPKIIIKSSNPNSNPIINLESDIIIENIKDIQCYNKIPEPIRNTIGSKDNYLNIDVKMETGTGKTFTQVKTIYELNSRFGFNKFIIVVPTIPIKAGTKQFIESKDTKTFFEDEYHDVKIDLKFIESSKNKKNKKDYFPGAIRDFVSASNSNKKHIEVMLINSHLLTTGKMLTKEYDTMIDDKFSIPCEAIKSTHPIVIIDEPHKFKEENATFPLIKKMFEPQCIIRFGATFPEIIKNKKIIKDYKNLIYNLTSIDAFNNDLVKGIKAEYIPASKDNIVFKLKSTFNKQYCNILKIQGNTQKNIVLYKNDKLSKLHEDFSGIEITGITDKELFLSNDMIWEKEKSLCPENFSLSYQDMIIETALQRHFDTEELNFKRNIKTLALFFIDSKEAYAKDSSNSQSGFIRKSFEKILKEKLKEKISQTKNDEYKQYLIESLNNISKCHAGYFYGDINEKDEETMEGVQDILYDKEKILRIKHNNSFNLRRFIFSKWTLREGWDNPNIFTIAKLRSSGSDTSKLQEVGRGLRLPVDNNLNRIDGKLYREKYGEEIYLNYIVDFREKDFINKLRTEINESSEFINNKINREQLEKYAQKNNINFTNLLIELLQDNIIGPKDEILNFEKLNNKCPGLVQVLKEDKVIESNTKNTFSTKIRKEKFEKISKLWELLNQKYIINYSIFPDLQIEEMLLSVFRQFSNNIDEITTKRQELRFNDNEIEVSEIAGLSLTTHKNLKYNEFLFKLYELTNIPIVNLHNALVHFNEEKKITPDFFNDTSLINFSIKINDWKNYELFKKFTYKKIDFPIHPTYLTTEDGNFKNIVALGNIGKKTLDQQPQEKYLYDTIAFDSEIEKNNILEEIQEVTVFGKIPKNSIKIPTANGGVYSPDFMYLVEKKNGKNELNLIIESKGMETERALSSIEADKIKCAKIFFENLKEDGINIKFERQLNNNRIGAIIKKLLNDND